MTKEQLQQLPADLQRKLLTLPLGATVDNFTAGEQASLLAVLGADWATLLGVTE